MSSAFGIEKNLKSILNTIPKEVKLIGVTKTITSDKILEAVNAGLKDIGENKVQEALSKYPDLSHLDLTWHLIGSLQTNKVKKAIEIFDLIHSVDRLNLAEVIDSESHKVDKCQKVLLQVNISGEISKSGFAKDELLNSLTTISRMKNIKVCGLMTIAENAVETKRLREIFSGLRILKEEINHKKYFDHNLDVLSMGMSNDYQVALEEGSNMIRLGRAIFGERN